MPASDDQQKEVIRLVLGLLDIERRLEIAENMLLITYHSKNSGADLKTVRLRIVDIVINSVPTEHQTVNGVNLSPWTELGGENSGIFNTLLNLAKTRGEHHLAEDLALFRQMHSKSRLEIALSTDDRDNEESKILDMLEHEPLTADEMKQLSPHTKRYPIPHNQALTKQYALILYNPVQRARFEVIKCEWSITPDMRKEMEKRLKEVKDKCSLITVCIMSHGYRGNIVGETGENLPINVVLDQLNERETFPLHLPMVRT